MSQAASRWSQYREEVKLFEVVREVTHGPEKKKKKKGAEAADERVLAVGRYRVWVFSRDAHKKRAQELAEFHLFDVGTINYNVDTHTIGFVLRPGIPVFKGTSLVFSCTHHAAVISALRESFRSISHGYPQDFLKIVTSERLPDLEAASFSQLDRLLGNYHGVCAYMSVPPNREIEFYLSDVVASGSVELDLSAIPAIEQDPERSPRNDMSALLLSLRFDTTFRSITFADSPQPAAVSALARALTTNRHATKIIASNTGASETQLIELAEALRANEGNVVQILDLSQNAFTPKASAELARAILVWRHPLTELVLVECNMPPRGVQSVFQALSENPAMSMSVNVLNMSGNRFELPGSQDLERWLSTLKVYSKLHRLSLRNCSLVLGAVPSLKLLAELTELDISDNKIDPSAMPTLTQLLELSPALTEVNCSGCGLVYEPTVKTMFAALLANSKGIAPHLSLANNSDLKGLGRELHELSTRLSGIDLTGVKLREPQWLEIAQYLAPMQGLSKVVFDDTITQVKTPSAVSQALIAIVKNPTVTHFSISNGFGKRIVLPVIKAVAADTKITTFNVAGNQIGDHGAEHIAQLLVNNKTLTALDMDNNHVHINGFLIVLTAFTKNTTLRSLKNADDGNRELAALTGSAHLRLVHVLASITAAVDRNSPSPITFWHPSSPSRTVLSAPMEVSELPSAPLFFTEKPSASISDVPALLGASSTMAAPISPRAPAAPAPAPAKPAKPAATATAEQAAPPAPSPGRLAPVSTRTLVAPPSLASAPRTIPALPQAPRLSQPALPRPAGQLVPPPKPTPPARSGNTAAGLPPPPAMPPPKPTAPPPRPPGMDAPQPKPALPPRDASMRSPEMKPNADPAPGRPVPSAPAADAEESGSESESGEESEGSTSGSESNSGDEEEAN